MRLDNGAVVLKVFVTVAPEKGMANKELFKLLTKTWGVSMQSLSLIQGKKNRNKLNLIAGEPDNLFFETCRLCKHIRILSLIHSRGQKP